MWRRPDGAATRDSPRFLLIILHTSVLNYHPGVLFTLVQLQKFLIVEVPAAQGALRLPLVREVAGLRRSSGESAAATGICLVRGRLRRREEEEMVLRRQRLLKAVIILSGCYC